MPPVTLHRVGQHLAQGAPCCAALGDTYALLCCSDVWSWQHTAMKLSRLVSSSTTLQTSTV
jgi:hypothetical protein